LAEAQTGHRDRTRGPGSQPAPYQSLFPSPIRHRITPSGPNIDCYYCGIVLSGAAINILGQTIAVPILPYDKAYDWGWLDAASPVASQDMGNEQEGARVNIDFCPNVPFPTYCDTLGFPPGMGTTWSFFEHDYGSEAAAVAPVLASVWAGYAQGFLHHFPTTDFAANLRRSGKLTKGLRGLFGYRVKDADNRPCNISGSDQAGSWS